MVTSLDIESFWNYASFIYDQNEIIPSKDDYEMKYVLDIFGKVLPHIFASFGTATGKRDPYMILKYLESKKSLPEFLIINDISPLMLNKTIESICNFKILDVLDIAHPLEDIIKDKLITPIKNTNPIFIFGVYNAAYVSNILNNYSKNIDIFGNIFTISIIFINNEGKLYKIKEEITFCISDYINHLALVIKYTVDKDFFAYSIKTNKNYVTHLFKKSNLLTFFDIIFPKYNIHVDTDKHNMIYTINDFWNNNEKKSIITLLNNTLGNIPWKKQHDAVIVLQTIFF
jgi:hypothetical protein